jgi:hypothetical protein
VPAFFDGREFKRASQLLEQQSERKMVSNYTQSADPRSNTRPGGNTIGARSDQPTQIAKDIDAQTLTGAQLAGTWQEDAELLTT